MPDEISQLLSACRSRLVTETAQRRWGRSLDYFIGRSKSSAGTQRVALARDVLESLVDSYGLGRAKEGRSGELGRAVESLRLACQRVVREDPTPLFAWGIIADVDAEQKVDLLQFIEAARRLEPVHGATFTFNPIILVAGRLVKPDWTGLGRLYLSEERRMAALKISPPPQLAEADLSAFLIESIEAGLERTDERTARKRLAWSSRPHRQLLAELANVAR